MNSILSIKSSVAKLNFEQSGYYNNIKTALQFAPSVNLLPFFDRLATYTAFLPSVVFFRLLGIDCKGNTVSSYDLDNSVPTVSNINNQIIVQYDGGTDLIGDFPSFDQGVYKYQIIMSVGGDYYSEPFLIDYSKFIPILGDFSVEDYNADFYTVG